LAKCFCDVPVVFILAVIADILAQQATADADFYGCVSGHSGFNAFYRGSCKIIFCPSYRSGKHFSLENTEYVVSLAAWTQYIVSGDIMLAARGGTITI
jgi:hypothetical protein